MLICIVIRLGFMKLKSLPSIVLSMRPAPPFGIVRCSAMIEQLLHVAPQVLAPQWPDSFSAAGWNLRGSLIGADQQGGDRQSFYRTIFKMFSDIAIRGGSENKSNQGKRIDHKNLDILNPNPDSSALHAHAHTHIHAHHSHTHTRTNTHPQHNVASVGLC